MTDPLNRALALAAAAVWGFACIAAGVMIDMSDTPNNLASLILVGVGATAIFIGLLIIRETP